VANRSRQAQPKMSPAQALALAKTLAKMGRIKYAKRTKTQTLEPYIYRILDAMQVRRALITDMSLIGHCLPRGLVKVTKNRDELTSEDVQEECRYLANVLGVDVAPSDTFVAVADRMRQRENH